MIYFKKRWDISRINRTIFILTGGMFYLNWILPTNPQSKNPVIIFLFYFGKRRSTFNYTERIFFCYIYGGIHVVLGVWYWIFNSSIFLNLENKIFLQKKQF